MGLVLDVVLGIRDSILGARPQDACFLHHPREKPILQASPFKEWLEIMGFSHCEIEHSDAARELLLKILAVNHSKVDSPSLQQDSSSRLPDRPNWAIEEKPWWSLLRQRFCS